MAIIPTAISRLSPKQNDIAAHIYSRGHHLLPVSGLSRETHSYRSLSGALHARISAEFWLIM